ncbi:hypothetical protein Trydic_g10576 [Trypoxylus dichotomus]
MSNSKPDPLLQYFNVEVCNRYGVLADRQESMDTYDEVQPQPSTSEGSPKVFEDAELRAMLDEDPCQTQQELLSALGVNRQAISNRLHALGMT